MSLFEDETGVKLIIIIIIIINTTDNLNNSHNLTVTMFKVQDHFQACEHLWKIHSL